ncbi:MAG: peptidase M64 N-terminal domain-containing protein [Butyricimonas paravirosa]
MKRIIALLPCMILLLQANLSWAQFDKYFHNKTLRMDYAHCGNSQHDEIYFEELLEEPYWGGSKTNLIDTMFYGNYYLNVYDVASNQLIYSRGYCTLFWEWQTTDEAKTTQRCCSESVVMPFPKNDVRIEISTRNKKGKFVKKFEYMVDVESYFIKKDLRMQFPTYDVLHGNPSRRVDIVLLPRRLHGR